MTHPDFSGYEVRRVTYAETKPLILEHHYAGRMPCITRAYGLFDPRGILCGVVTFGPPASPWLCRGVCGPEYREYVLELNRLVLLHNRPNEASFLTGNALRLLGAERPCIIVSYADTQHQHVGTVYQACNFLFTGTTRPRTDMASSSGGHSRHHAGDRTKRVLRSAKHRYVTFLGDARMRRRFARALRYPVLPYPKKGDEDSH